MNLKELIEREGATIVDVREPWELTMGQVDGAINIPLGQVPGRVEEFRAMSKPLILICASGNRSGQAAAFLKSRGLTDTYNGGGWREVQYLKLQTV